MIFNLKLVVKKFYTILLSLFIITSSNSDEISAKVSEYVSNLIPGDGDTEVSIDLTENNMDNCLKSSNAQDVILNQRIEAQKKYKIESTPTIYVNEKKYSGKVNYKKFKEIIEKNL